MCGRDPRTAQAHLPSLIGLELVGPNFRGKLRGLNTEAGPWAIVDPPSDTWMDKTPRKKEDLGIEWIALGAGAVLAAVGLNWLLSKK